jgi:Icc-related predicted phosphoesterase
MAETNDKTTLPPRIAALGDLHCKANSQGAFHDLFSRISQAADVMILCGDLTDHGLPDETRVLVKEMSTASTIPAVAVLGNHDYESGQNEEVKKILCDAGVHLLDGDATEVLGVGFAGAKGFAGGFGRGTLSSFGEPIVKAFVQAAVDEAMKLEASLLRLRTPHRIAVLHYSPISATVAGEPAEIYPFLGCSRLEEPLNRYQVTACVHGHAHKGAAEGKTAIGTPVYNVSLPLLKKLYPDKPPFRMIELNSLVKPAG